MSLPAATRRCMPLLTSDKPSPQPRARPPARTHARTHAHTYARTHLGSHEALDVAVYRTHMLPAAAHQFEVPPHRQVLQGVCAWPRAATYRPDVGWRFSIDSHTLAAAGRRVASPAQVNALPVLLSHRRQHLASAS